MFIFSLIFLSGIVIVNYLAIIPSFTILCILIIILLGLIKKHKSISYFLILVCAIHLTAHELYCLKHEQWLLSHFINRSVSVKGMLISKQRDFFTLSVNTVCLKNELAKSSASCLKFKHLTMMVNVNSQQDSFNLQDEITFKTKLKRKQEFYNFTDDISMFQAGGTNANIKNIYLKEQNVIKLVKAKVNLREYLLKKYSAYISKLDNAGLMLALIFGDKDLISLEQKNIFQNTGTGHLLAISGMHLSFIYFLILKILKRLRLLNCNNSNFNRLHVSYVLAWFVTAFYGYIAGFSIATQRAFIAISFFLLCKLFHFNMFSFDVWSCCLVLVLLYDVNAINGMGFWLSFIATFGLLYTHTSRFVFWQKKTFYPPKWNKMAFDNIMLSCKTFIILLPISILFFNKGG